MTQLTPISLVIWLFKVSLKSHIFQTTYGTLMSYSSCPSSKHKELKKCTILPDKNRNQESTHRIHQIIPVQPLGNYKTTALTRFFPPPAVPLDPQNQFQLQQTYHLLD